MQPTVEYLGYRIDAQGIHVTERNRSHKKGARTRKSASAGGYSSELSIIIQNSSVTIRLSPIC